MVAPVTDLAWTPYFLRASGLVVEIWRPAVAPLHRSTGVWPAGRHGRRGCDAPHPDGRPDQARCQRRTGRSGVRRRPNVRVPFAAIGAEFALRSFIGQHRGWHRIRSGAIVALRANDMGRHDVSAPCFADVRDGAAVWTTNAVEATILYMSFAKPMPGMASKSTTGIAFSICGPTSASRAWCFRARTGVCASSRSSRSHLPMRRRNATWRRAWGCLLGAAATAAARPNIAVLVEPPANRSVRQRTCTSSYQLPHLRLKHLLSPVC
jgi:hypothetical protein